MRLTFKKEDWVKETGPNGGGCHPISWRHEKNKNLPLSKRIPPAWQPLNWDIGCFLLSESNWSFNSSWVSSLLVFVLKLYHQLSRDPDGWLTLQILGLVSFYNHTRQFPMVNLFLYIHICTLLVLFFWRTITNSIHHGFQFCLLIVDGPPMCAQVSSRYTLWLSTLFHDEEFSHCQWENQEGRNKRSGILLEPWFRAPLHLANTKHLALWAQTSPF